MDYKNGIYQMPEEEYFAINRVSSHGLMIIYDESPYSLDYDISRDKSGIGKATHKYCETLSVSSVLCLPSEKGYSSLETQASQEFVRRNPNKIILSSKDYGKYVNMIESMTNRKDDETTFCRDIINDKEALREAVILFDIDGIPAKARLDLFHPAKKIVVDHKTTKEGKNKFKRDFEYMRYWLQLHFYALAASTHLGLEIDEITPYIFSFQTEAPYVVQPHIIRYSSEVFELIYALCYEWRQIKAKTAKPYNYYKNGKSILEVNNWVINEIKFKIKDLLGE